jgi:hypothetical protein
MKSQNSIQGMMLTALSALVMLQLGCAQGLNTSAGSSSGAGAASSGSNGTGSGAQSTTNPVATGSWADVTSQMNGFASGGAYDGSPMIKIDTVNHNIELIFPIPSIGTSFSPIIPAGVTGLDGVSVGPAAMPDGSEAWMITVPISLILKGATFPSNFNALPNGNPLPYFPSEEVHGLAVGIPSRPGYNVNLYIGVKAVAAFVAIPKLNMPIGFGVNVVNSTKTRNIGYFALIPQVNTFDAGVYLAAQVPTDMAQELNSLLSP